LFCWILSAAEDGVTKRAVHGASPEQEKRRGALLDKQRLQEAAAVERMLAVFWAASARHKNLLLGKQLVPMHRGCYERLQLLDRRLNQFFSEKIEKGHFGHSWDVLLKLIKK
jgi:hypothetical protein